MERWARVSQQVDEAAEMLRLSFPRLALEAEARERFEFLHSGVADGKWSIHRLTIRGAGSAVGSVSEPFAAGRLRSGRSSLSYGPHDVDTTAPYLRPVGASELAFYDPSFELLVFSPEPYRQRAQKYLRGTSRRLTVPTGADTAPVSPVAGRHWEAASAYVHAVADDPELFGSKLIREQAHDLALRTFLTTFPVTADAVSVPGTRTPAPSAAIRRALQHLDENVAEAVTVADVADAAGLSVRALHDGFRRHVGTSVMHYLRDRRLEAARRQLVDGAPDSTTVSLIARRWGFTHLSRFSADYHRRFDEYPRDTLRR